MKRIELKEVKERLAYPNEIRLRSNYYGDMGGFFMLFSVNDFIPNKARIITISDLNRGTNECLFFRKTIKHL